MFSTFERNLLPVFVTAFLLTGTAAAGQLSGAIQTTNKSGAIVNQNIYAFDTDVYLSGGPQNRNASGLPDGAYYFQVTDPSGKKLLSTDNAVCRKLQVIGGRVAGATGSCPHANGTFDLANGTLPVQLAPFSKTPNNGGEYKVWLVPVGKATIGSDPKVLNFPNSDSKTDNFKVVNSGTPAGACQPSSSLSVLVTGTNVVSYVPKGSWSGGAPGVSVAKIEGSVTPTAITPPIATVVNSCASNPLTGQTVCTGNNNDVYVITSPNGGGTSTAAPPLTSGGSGTIFFSGGVCTNCSVALDSVHNKVAIGLSVGGTGGFQFLNLGTSTFEPAFASPARVISEDPLIDPVRNLLLSANENNDFELVDISTTTSPASFVMPTFNGGELDASAEDCDTGIALAGAEFTDPSEVFLADLTQATFTPGSPGTWTAPSTDQTLTESSLSSGATGLAVAQGTHTGIVSGEFGGDAITAIALPATSGSGSPVLPDWVTCTIGSGFSMGFDPHTLTAYKSPNSGDAIAVLANDTATTLAVVDLTKMLDPAFVPRTSGPGLGHACAADPLPASVLRFVPVP